MLIISYVLQTFKQINIILNVSYFLGILWYIMCVAEEDFGLGVKFHESPEAREKYPEYFVVYHKLWNRDAMDISIISMYFAFTSLSTVGFGDYHPRSDLERFVCAFILLFGVAIFSMIMATFIQILQSIQAFNKGLDDGE